MTTLTNSPTTQQATSIQALRNVRILSLALNLPGPAALLRCAQMGAQCTKLEPLASDNSASADDSHQ